MLSLQNGFILEQAWLPESNHHENEKAIWLCDTGRDQVFLWSWERAFLSVGAPSPNHSWLWGLLSFPDYSFVSNTLSPSMGALLCFNCCYSCLFLECMLKALLQREQQSTVFKLECSKWKLTLFIKSAFRWDLRKAFLIYAVAFLIHVVMLVLKSIKTV